MTLKVTQLMPSFSGAAASQTASVTLPLGLSFEQLYLTYSGITLAQMTNIVVKANGKEIMNFRSGTELDRFNQFQGRAAASGVLAIDFCRYGMRTRAAEEYTKLGTGFPVNTQEADSKGNANPLFNPYPVTILTLQIDCAAATTPVFTLYACLSDPAPTGFIRKIQRFEYSASAGGQYQISDLPKGDLINMAFFIATDITALQVTRDKYTVFDRTDTLNDVIQLDGVRVPLSYFFAYDPTENGNGSEGLPTAGVNDLRFILTKTASGSIPTTIDYIGLLSR